MTGQPAASYEVRGDSGRIAQVTVWSEGAYLANDGSGADAHVALEVQNVSDTTVTLDATKLRFEAFDAAGAPLTPRLIGISPSGSTASASGSTPTGARRSPRGAT